MSARRWLWMGAGLALAMPWLTAGGKPPEANVTCRVELDRGILPAARANRAVVKVTLEAPPPPARHARPPVNLCLVLDRSGSMSGDKIERAKDAAIAAVRRLRAGDIVSLVIYDHEVETLVPAQDAANIEWIESRIRSIESRGNTALYGGVSQGAAEVRKHTGRKFVSRILLLSDGLANVGPSSPDDLARLGTSLLKEGISVTTVGVGMDYNEDLMTRLAAASDGNTYFVADSGDLPRIFAAELGDVLSVVARDVVIEIECADGIRPVRVIGRDGVIRDNRILLRLNQLYGGQEKFALVEVDVPATEARQTRRVAQAKVDYNNALTEAHDQSVASVDVCFSAEDAEVQKSANLTVQQDTLRNVTAETRNKAIELSDQGQQPAAAQALREQAQALNDYAAFNGVPAMAEEADKLNREADRVEAGGYDRALRKGARTESANVIQQQSKQ